MVTRTRPDKASLGAIESPAAELRDLSPSAAKQDRRARDRTERILKRFHEEEVLGKAYDARLIRKLWPFVKPYRALLGLALGMIVLTAAGALLRPIVMLETIDRGVMQKDSSVLLTGGLVLAGILLLDQLLSFIQIYTLQIVGARSMARLRRHTFAFLHEQRLAFFDRQPVGRLVTRVTNDIDAILELFASGALNAFGDLIRLVGIVVMMLVLDFDLSLIAFAAVPPVALVVALVRRRSREAFREIRAKTARMNATMNEQVSGMRVIQGFRRQHAAAAEFDAINSSYRDAAIKSAKYEAMQDAAIEMVEAVCLAFVIVALGYHPVSFGTVVAFSAYLSQFFQPISALAQRYTLLQSAMAGAERVFGLLETRGQTDQADHRSLPAGDASLALSFEHVGFSYKPGVPVLRDVSFSARRGEKIALVGPTGSGKTTVTALLLRLYEAEDGVVRVDGDDVRSLPRDQLRRRFSVVPQEVFLFPGSVASNIAAGQAVDRERVESVLRRVGAWDLFRRRPGGIDAKVEEHGANFSAGERQLIAFCRALYRDASILILDEATASVDSDTEARLKQALAAVTQGRTSLMIAHRLSTIAAADRIIVMFKGRIAEQGSHAELLAAGGLYARLYRLQFQKERSSQGGSLSKEPAPPVEAQATTLR